MLGCRYTDLVRDAPGMVRSNHEKSKRGKQMDVLALILFAVAALGGLFLLWQHLQGAGMPGSIAIVHGAVAATALVLLLIAYLMDDISGLASVALIVFVVAALGGFYLASFHLRGERHPTALIFGHGGIAVVAFVLLLLAVIGV